MILLNLNIFISNTQKLNITMASNPLFNCCNGFQPVDKSQTSLVTISRNNYIKTKKLQALHSPKASLKSLTSLKSLRNLENYSGSSQIHLASTRDVVNQFPTKFQYLVSPNVLTPQRIDNVNLNRQFYLSPSANKEIMYRSSAPKQKVHFSYSDPRNPQNMNPILLAPIYKSDIRPTQVKTEIQYSTPVLKNIQEQKPAKNVLKESQNKGLSKSSRIESKKTSTIVKCEPTAQVLQSRINLGGSKYTIISQGQMEQHNNDKQARMQQSAIIVNVFNPTKSQLQKWQHGQRKQSFGQPQNKRKLSKQF